MIKNAKGLAIFTTMRTGLWVSGAGGSGVLIGKLPDGSWSPPSGLMLHTAGLGFLVGIDIYDCVMVINTEEALQAFTKIRCTVGGEMSAVAGPVGMGGVLESEVHKRRAPVFTYLKSRGFYAGVQLDGTILIERTDENERFYNEKISALDIISGKVRHTPYECRGLIQTIKAAQGDQDVDESVLPTEPTPSDFDIADDTKPFGIPDKEDPDPFGFLALQAEGLIIREAGTQKRASVDQFVFNPLPTSPIYGSFNRQSIDASMSRRSSWRTSMISNGTTLLTDRSTQTTDMSTQTDFDSPAISPAFSSVKSPKMAEIAEETTTLKPSQPPPLPERNLEVSRPVTPPNPVSSPNVDSEYKADDEAPEADHDDDVVVYDEPVVHEVTKAASPKFVARARLVTVQKRPPPTLPPRNPGRDRKPVVVNAAPSNGEENTTELLTPPEMPSHSRRSSESTFRELSSGHRSNSEASISSVEQLSGLEKHLATFKVEDEAKKVDLDEPKDETKGMQIDDEKNKMEKDEKETDTFHSIPPTPAAEATNPLHTQA